MANYIYCSKCGAPMKEDARYCMKCGTLNYDHPDNQYMKKYMDKTNDKNKNNNKFFSEEIPASEIVNDSSNDVVVGGKVIRENSLIEQKEVKSYNYGARIVYTLLFSLVCFLYFVVIRSMKIDFSIYVSIYLFSIIFSVITMINIYQKAGCSFFTVFIPFYAQYTLCEMVFDKGILFLLLFVPIVNIVFSFVFLYKLGEKFGINGVLSVLFFPIVLLIISYSNKYHYNGRTFDNKSSVSIIGILFLILYLILLFFSISRIPVLL